MEFYDPDCAWREIFKGEYQLDKYHGKGQLEYEDGTKEIEQWFKNKREEVQLVSNPIFIYWFIINIKISIFLICLISLVFFGPI